MEIAEKFFKLCRSVERIRITFVSTFKFKQNGSDSWWGLCFTICGAVKIEVRDQRLRSKIIFKVPDNLPQLQVNLGGSAIRGIIGVMKHNRFVLGLSSIGFIVLVLMLNLTSPMEIGPFGVLLFFTTFYLVAFGLITLGVKVFCRLALKKETFRRKDYLYTAVAGFLPIMLLMARSFGVVNVWTVSLIGLFIILVEFFIYKRV